MALLKPVHAFAIVDGEAAVNDDHIKRVEFSRIPDDNKSLINLTHAEITYSNKTKDEYQPSLWFRLYDAYGLEVGEFSDIWEVLTVHPGEVRSEEAIVGSVSLNQSLRYTGIILPADWATPAYLTIENWPPDDATNARPKPPVRPSRERLFAPDAENSPPDDVTNARPKPSLRPASQPSLPPAIRLQPVDLAHVLKFAQAYAIKDDAVTINGDHIKKVGFTSVPGDEASSGKYGDVVVTYFNRTKTVTQPSFVFHLYNGYTGSLSQRSQRTYGG